MNVKSGRSELFPEGAVFKTPKFSDEEYRDMKKIRIQSYFDRDVHPGLDCQAAIEAGEPVHVKESERDSCDLKKIVERYAKTDGLQDLVNVNRRYADFSSAPSFQEAMDIVVKAEQQFEALPAKTREFFANDPARMLAFVADPENKGQLVKLGLAVKTVEPPGKATQPAAGAPKAPGGGAGEGNPPPDDSKGK